MQSYTGGAEPVSPRQRFRLSFDGSGPVRESLFTQKLLPSDSWNIHQPMTATAVWKMVQPTSSSEFLARFKTRFVQKNPPLPNRVASGFSSDEGRERKSTGGSVLAASEPAEMADSREISKIAEQQGQEEIPRLRSRPTDQKHVATISDWLSTINHQEMHNFKSSERYYKTGVWISTDDGFQKWRDTSQSSVFWLHGGGEIINWYFNDRELTQLQREVANRSFRTLILANISSRKTKLCEDPLLLMPFRQTIMSTLFISTARISSFGTMFLYSARF